MFFFKQIDLVVEEQPWQGCYWQANDQQMVPHTTLHTLCTTRQAIPSRYSPTLQQKFKDIYIKRKCQNGKVLSRNP
jgi:hypothetical protein